MNVEFDRPAIAQNGATVPAERQAESLDQIERQSQKTVESGIDDGFDLLLATFGSADMKTNDRLPMGIDLTDDRGRQTAALKRGPKRRA